MICQDRFIEDAELKRQGPQFLFEDFWHCVFSLFFHQFSYLNFVSELPAADKNPWNPSCVLEYLFAMLLLSYVRSRFQMWHLESTWSFGRILEVLSLFLILWKLGSSWYFKIWKLIRMADQVSLRSSQKLHQAPCPLDSNCLEVSGFVNVFFWNSIKCSSTRCQLGK